MIPESTPLASTWSIAIPSIETNWDSTGSTALGLRCLDGALEVRLEARDAACLVTEWCLLAVEAAFRGLPKFGECKYIFWPSSSESDDKETRERGRDAFEWGERRGEMFSDVDCGFNKDDGRVSTSWDGMVVRVWRFWFRLRLRRDFGGPVETSRRYAGRGLPGTDKRSGESSS